MIRLLLLLFVTIPGAAQHLIMHNNMTQASKNIYLTIMDSMMMKMKLAPEPLSPNADFMQEMIPHHQGAIEMAVYEIEHGNNFEIIQLAKSILAEQTIEVSQMKYWLNEVLTDTSVISSQYQTELNMAMEIMMNNMQSNANLDAKIQIFLNWATIKNSN